MKNLKALSFLFTLTFLILGTTNSSAKTKFLQAEIVKDGKTYSGYIKYKQWKSTPRSIQFKSSLAAKAETLTPASIDQFIVSGRRFKSAVIALETSSKNSYYYETGKNPKLEKQAAFIEEVVSGDKSLFTHIDKSKRAHFYIQNKGNYDLLIHKTYYTINDDGTANLKHYNLFHYQLYTYLENCEEVIESVIKTSYNRASITTLFRQYKAYQNNTSEELLSSTSN